MMPKLKPHKNHPHQLKNSPSIVVFVSLGLAFISFPELSLAFQEIEISEINYSGYTQWSDDTVTDANDEFIELKNTSPQTSRSVTGWSLRIVSGSSDKTIMLTGEISDYLIIRRVPAAQAQTVVLDKVITVSNSQFGSLHNQKGAYIELRDAAGFTIDAVNMYGKWPHLTKQGESLHKIDNLSWEAKLFSPLNQVSTPIIPSPPITPQPVPPLEPVVSVIYSGVRISEIYPNPVVGGKEFVELENITDKDIDLAGWKLDDILVGGSKAQLLAEIIPAKGFRLLEEDKDLKIILNNDADSVHLIDPNGVTQDSLSYNMTQKEKGSSYMRLGENWIWNSAPSPGKLNLSPEIVSPAPNLPIVDSPLATSPPPSPTTPPILPRYEIGSVIISEVYPYPESGQEEFIEIQNISNQTIDLTDWVISDLAKSYRLSGILKVGEYKLLPQSISKIALNNTSETIILTDNYQQVQSVSSYLKARQALSYIPLVQTWGWTSSPSPGVANIFAEPSIAKLAPEYQKIDDFSTLSSLEDSQLLNLTGQVVILPHQLSKTSFYIYNQRLIRVYDRQQRFPELKEGDMVSIQGEWHSSETQQYLKTDAKEDIQVASSQALSQFNPQKVSELQAEDWGKLVQIVGNLELNSSTKLEILTSKSPISVKLYADSVSKPAMRKGDIVSVIGFTEIYDGEIRVIPWQAGQIIVRAINKPKNQVSEAKLTKSRSLDSAFEAQSVQSPEPVSEIAYQSLDSFKLPFAENSTDLGAETAWYNLVRSWVESYPLFLLAILLNIIWTLYRLSSK